jgi:hypothetical protein
MTPDDLIKVRTQFLLLRDQLDALHESSIPIPVELIEPWSVVWQSMGAMTVDLGLDPIDNTKPAPVHRGGLETAERG